MLDAPTPLRPPTVPLRPGQAAAWERLWRHLLRPRGEETCHTGVIPAREGLDGDPDPGG